MLFRLSTPRGQITIREATTEDAGQLLALRLESLINHPKAFAADVAQTTSDGVKAFVDRITEYKEAHIGTIIIALAAAELIGMTGIACGHWPKMRHGGGLWGVYVSPDWRGFRIGEGMIEGCIEWGKQYHLSVVYLSVTLSEIPAIRCYTRCGFREYGIEPRTFFVDGHYYAQVLMYKLIDDGNISE